MKEINDETRNLIKEQLQKKTEKKDTFEEPVKKKKAKKQKIIVQFQDEWFDFFHFSRLKTLERYDQTEEELVYTLRLLFSVAPYENDFDFPTEEARKAAIVKLKLKLQIVKVKFI
jgi:hypothetical protein